MHQIHRRKLPARSAAMLPKTAGGVHCLKYGLTANNVLGLEMVLITGEVVRLGGKHLDSGGL